MISGKAVLSEAKNTLIDLKARQLIEKFEWWHLNAISWFDFEDVEQIIRFHIFKKWDQWDQKRALEPWVNKIISNHLISWSFYMHKLNYVRVCIYSKIMNGTFHGFNIISTIHWI